MRAKRALSEFLENGVKSQQTLQSLSRTSADNNVVPSDDPLADETTSQNMKFAQKVAERIVSSSSQILRGVFVSRVSQDGEKLTVEITSTKQSIGAARQIKALM
jgi:hypothetical protein